MKFAIFQKNTFVGVAVVVPVASAVPAPPAREVTPIAVSFRPLPSTARGDNASSFWWPLAGEDA